MPLNKTVTLICCVVMAGAFPTGFAQAEQLSPPPYSIQNRHHVNLASGHVSPTLEDVSIGGNMGLTHSLSTYSSNFVSDGAGGSWGYKDKFRGGLYKRLHHDISSIANDRLYVITAYDDTSSVDFRINSDGETFTALGYPRYILEFVNNPTYKPGFVGFVLTKPDGTLVFYKTPTTNHDFTGEKNPYSAAMSEVQYPNGFTINVTHKSQGQWSPIASVTTNTGFQLKYVYVKNTAVPYTPATTTLPAADSVNWSDTLPRYLWAINNAVDYCSPLPNNFALPPAQACPVFTQSWPTVSYEWPNGMPRAMYLANGVFKVTDAHGGVTEYRHSPHSTYLDPAQPNPNIFVPRLTSIKHADSSVANVYYEYKNVGYTSSGGSFPMLPTYIAGPVGQLKRSSIGDDAIAYTIGASGQYGGFSTNGSGGHQNTTVSMHALYGIYKIEAWDKKVELQMGYTNMVYRVEKKLGGGVIELDYDDRGNIVTLTENGMTTTAHYPASCTPSTRKTCNQATWVRDPKNNQTDYTYHAASGQVATVTYPANEQGIRAQTRYTYEQKHATYYTGPGTKTQSSLPIWLKTEERFCTNSTAGDNGCAGNDEVVTHFEYDHDNLLLTGLTIYSQADNKTQRTCYQYDVYGNRIGETRPRANLASCQ